MTDKQLIQDALMLAIKAHDGQRRKYTGEPYSAHPIGVSKIIETIPDHTPEMVAAALLHDVGKNISNLGFFSRVIATVVGPRGQRFIAYHDHERLGAELLDSISDPRTVALVGGLVDDEISLLLKEADDI